MGPQAISPECFHGVHEACYCLNSCGCMCHVLEECRDEENIDIDEWLDMVEDQEFSQNGYC